MNKSARVFIASSAAALSVCAFASQQHAPTPDVCRADYALWYSTEISEQYSSAQSRWLSDGVPNRTEQALLDMAEISARADEMGKCAKTDREKSSAYYDASEFYDEIFTQRVERFITRHHLNQQMIDEDKKGLR
jgi:hypothetical protein